MKMMKMLPLAILTAAFSVGCSHWNNRTEKPGEEVVTTEAQKMAEKRGEHLVTTLSFDRGQSDLTSDAKAELQKAIADARAMGEIDDVTVAVWSDLAYPARQKKLPSTQVRLADKRGDRIEDYLAKDLNVSSYRVGVHNMGEKPNFMSDFLKTADADLKEQLVNEGLASNDDSITNKSASKALVFIKLK